MYKEKSNKISAEFTADRYICSNLGAFIVETYENKYPK